MTGDDDEESRRWRTVMLGSDAEGGVGKNCTSAAVVVAIVERENATKEPHFIATGAGSSRGGRSISGRRS